MFLQSIAKYNFQKIFILVHTLSLRIDLHTNSLLTVARALLKCQACVVVFLIIGNKMKRQLSPKRAEFKEINKSYQGDENNLLNAGHLLFSLLISLLEFFNKVSPTTGNITFSHVTTYRISGE